MFDVLDCASFGGLNCREVGGCVGIGVDVYVGGGVARPVYTKDCC